jgi:hypothetical protein
MEADYLTISSCLTHKHMLKPTRVTHSSLPGPPVQLQLVQSAKIFDDQRSTTYKPVINSAFLKHTLYVQLTLNHSS